MKNDKAGKPYWNLAWDNAPLPEVFNPRAHYLKDYVNSRFHAFFCRIFSTMDTRGMKLLELGCARSMWLPYFAKEFGFEVFGIDYSEKGCQLAKDLLSNEGVSGEIICNDFFSPSESLLEKFDIVVSFGVAEHFQDTGECINAFSKFLKPNGILITNIPNMVGLIGIIEKIINRSVYDIHKLVDSDSLKKAHEKVGLEDIECNYFIFTNFGVCNLQGVKPGSISWIIKKVLLAVLVRFSMLVWFIECRVGHLKPNRFFAPYINCLAYKRKITTNINESQ